ncbi:hypothetical protein QSJ18_20120, partial [Gordonia sp. ABSL1-1]|nr:hypothetical protein [Gordonia sp. ABSL1-1]
MVEDYPIVWLPTPYLDLNSPDGTFIRAAFESSNRQKNLGNAAYYPGFRHASLSAWLWYGPYDGPYSTFGEPPNTTYVWAAPFPDPDPQGRHDWTPLSRDVGGIALCSISTNTTVKRHRLFFTYRRTGRTPPTNQHGPHPAPTTNVFGS